MTEHEELRPCPFCGGEPISLPSGDGTGTMIQCMTPDCVNPHVSYYGDGEAAKRWNRRPDPVPSAGVGVEYETDEIVRYVARFGGMCRGCADEDGICPNSGLTCDGDKGIRHVLKALTYGLRLGYITLPVEGPNRADGWRPTHRHVKRGTTYRTLGSALIQMSSDVLIEDDEEVTVYQGEDGRLWVRPTAEFNDGRFEPLPQAPEEGR